MARYLVETDAGVGGDRPPDLARAERRCPEVAVERRYQAHEGDGPDLWLCQAPSVTHVEHWAGAAGLEVRSVRRVDVAARSAQRAGRATDLHTSTTDTRRSTEP